MKGDIFMVKKYSFLLIIFAAILWSADGLLRRNLYSLPPTVVVFYEHLIGLLILMPFIVPKLSELKKLSKKDLLAFGWVALLSGVLGTVMYTAALGKVNYISYSVVVLLQQLQPLFVIFFARFLLKETVSYKYMLWALIALVGAYLLSFPNLVINFSENSQQITAALLAIGAAFCWGSSTAFSRFGLQKIPSYVATGFRFSLTLPIALIFIFITNSQEALTKVTATQQLNLLGIALSTGMVGLIIYYQGLKFTQAKVSAIAELFWPLSAVVIGFFFIGDRFTPTQVIGGILILGSMNQIIKAQKVYVPKPE